jgi:hypothetical protein
MWFLRCKLKGGEMEEPGVVYFPEGTLSKIIILLDRLRELRECRETIAGAVEMNEGNLSACDAGLDRVGAAAL